MEIFLVDDETWAVRYLIVDTNNWWLGHKVLISPEWIKDVSWNDRTVSIQQTRQAVKEAPRYDPEKAWIGVRKRVFMTTTDVASIGSRPTYSPVDRVIEADCHLRRFSTPPEVENAKSRTCICHHAVRR